jgi:hypothetical protein
VLGSAFELLGAKRHWVEAYGLPPTGWQRVRDLARSLPPAFSSYYLEWHLANPERLDFLPLLDHRVGGTARVARGPSSCSSVVQSAAWSRVVAIAQAGEYEYVWLEFDLPEAAAGACTPSLGVCVEKDYTRRHDGTDVRKSTTLESALAALERVGGDSARGMAVHLTRIHEAIPVTGNLINVMFMWGRVAPALKLYLSVPSAEVEPFLRAILWPGAWHALPRALALAGEHRTAFLDLTILNSLQGRLGIAVSQFHLSERANPDPAWSDILDAWVVRGLASEQIASDLRRWPGAEPGSVSGIPTWTTRWLDLKVVLDETGTILGKAYCGFRAERLPPLAAAMMSRQDWPPWR